MSSRWNTALSRSERKCRELPVVRPVAGDPHFTTHEYDVGLAHALSKTANVVLTVELDRRWAGDRIRAYAALVQCASVQKA